MYLAGRADPNVSKGIFAVPGAEGEKLNLISVRMSRVGRIHRVGGCFPMLNDGKIDTMQQLLRSFVEEARRLVQDIALCSTVQGGGYMEDYFWRPHRG